MPVCFSLPVSHLCFSPITTLIFLLSSCFRLALTLHLYPGLLECASCIYSIPCIFFLLSPLYVASRFFSVQVFVTCSAEPSSLGTNFQTNLHLLQGDETLSLFTKICPKWESRFSWIYFLDYSVSQKGLIICYPVGDLPEMAKSRLSFATSPTVSELD